MENKTNKMIKIVLILIVIVTIASSILFVFWQKSLASELEDQPQYCGGDFNWDQPCPVGTYCSGGGSLEGGKCKAILPF